MIIRDPEHQPFFPSEQSHNPLVSTIYDTAGGHHRRREHQAHRPRSQHEHMSQRRCRKTAGSVLKIAIQANCINPRSRCPPGSPAVGRVASPFSTRHKVSETRSTPSNQRATPRRRWETRSAFPRLRQCPNYLPRQYKNLSDRISSREPSTAGLPLKVLRSWRSFMASCSNSGLAARTNVRPSRVK